MAYQDIGGLVPREGVLYLLRGEEEAQGSPGGLDVWVICATEEQVGQLARPSNLFYRLQIATPASDRTHILKTCILRQGLYPC